jgi:hypothetical protein
MPARSDRSGSLPRRLRDSWPYRAAVLILFSFLRFAALAAVPEPPKGAAEVKADYLFLFTKYVEWPADVMRGTNQPIVIGVVGDDAVAEALERRVKGRTTQGGRKVTALRVRRIEDFAGCHVVFVGVGERRSLRDLVEATRSNSTLMVCDTDAMFAQGAMIKLVMVEGTVRFEVKMGPMERAGLSAHSGMLGSAKRVWPRTSSGSEAP